MAKLGKHSSRKQTLTKFSAARLLEDFAVGTVVKNLPAKQEMQIRSLGQKGPLEKEKIAHPVFLPGKSHGQRSLVGYTPWGCKGSDKTE